MTFPHAGRGWIAVTLALAACGGTTPSKTSTDVNQAVVPSALAPTTSAPNTSAADKAAVATMVLKASDLPGWDAVAHSSSNSSQDKQIDAQLSSCLHVDSTLLSQDSAAASADSPDFSMNSGTTEVQNSVEIDTTQASVDQGFALLQRADFPGCLNQAFKTAFLDRATNGATITGVTTTALAVTPLLTQTVATRTTITLAVRGLTVPVFADFVFMQKARVIAFFFFLHALTPFDTNEARLLTDIVANRITAAGVA
jgi:hypothetical protein